MHAVPVGRSSSAPAQGRKKPSGPNRPERLYHPTAHGSTRNRWAARPLGLSNVTAALAPEGTRPPVAGTCLAPLLAGERAVLSAAPAPPGGEAMLPCPRCHTDLEAAEYDQFVLETCPRCGGRWTNPAD